MQEFVFLLLLDCSRHRDRLGVVASILIRVLGLPHYLFILLLFRILKTRALSNLLLVVVVRKWDSIYACMLISG